MIRMIAIRIAYCYNEWGREQSPCGIIFFQKELIFYEHYEYIYREEI